MASWLGGGDDTDTDVEEADGDDEFAMDDDFGMDDFDDDFGGMDDGEAGGANTTELENRIEDLESEIANVSSTANTVRSENEQISEKVDDVEENVRKLLEIYEMVTRGVNPFVDDVSAEAGMGGDGGSFGLFDEEETDESDAADEDLDSDIADAEAEDFFDDDAFDDFDDEFEGDDEGSFEEFDEMDDDGMDGDEMGDIDEPEMEESEDMTDEDGESGGGTSFEELKAEYESGDADWADEDLDEVDDGGDEDEFSVEEGEDDATDLFLEDDLEEEAETAAEPETPPETEGVGDELAAVEEQADTAAEQSVPTDDAARGATQDATGGDTEAGGFQFGAAAATPRGDEPYLERPPDGYLADVVILEWLEYLLDTYDARNAVRAINYYERIGWIGEPMRDHCVEMLLGITDAEYVYRDEFGSTDVTMADHRKSLQYVEELAGGRLDRSFADRFDTREGNGI